MGPTGASQRSVFRPDVRIVQASGDGVDFVNLAVGILEKERLHPVKNADGAALDRGGGAVGINTFTGHFYADQLA